MEIIGIDIGSSGTKIAGYKNGEFCGFLRAVPPKSNAELNSAINAFLDSIGFSAERLEKIVLTGVKSEGFNPGFPDSKIIRVDEFSAIAYGGLLTSGVNGAYVISMGTGTAFVRAEHNKNGITACHIGGTGIGGGFLSALSQTLCNERDVMRVAEMAKRGDIGKVDLRLMDLRPDSVGTLTSEITVSNFGKLEPDASESDCAIGILTAVYQIIGMLAVFACRSDVINTFVLIGALAELPQATEIFEQFVKAYGISFHVPDNAEFAVAKGAVLKALEDYE